MQGVNYVMESFLDDKTSQESNAVFAYDTPIAHKTLSETIWNIDWNNYFPYSLDSNDIIIKKESFETANSFIEKNKNITLPKNDLRSHFLINENYKLKLKYYKEICDVFSIYDKEDSIIGIYITEPIDWSSYYIRYTNLLPKSRGSNISVNFTNYLLEILKKYPVDRLVCEVSPSNLRMVKRLSELKFNITGNSLSERWGSLITFTKFLNEKNEKFFISNFCTGLRPQVD